jgi:hypothetical protein
MKFSNEEIHKIMENFDQLMMKEQSKNNKCRRFVLFCNPNIYKEKWKLNGVRRYCYYESTSPDCLKFANGYIQKNNSHIIQVCWLCALRKSHSSREFCPDKIIVK